jgi:hypothetical protein
MLLKDPVQRRGGTNIGFQETESITTDLAQTINDRWQAFAQVVQNDHMPSTVHQFHHRMGADKSGATGIENGGRHGETTELTGQASDKASIISKSQGPPGSKPRKAAANHASIIRRLDTEPARHLV